MDTASGKSIEISILEMASAKLREACGRWTPDGPSDVFDKSLRFNQKVWDVFQAEWSNEKSLLPIDLRQNLLSLSIFVRKQTFDAITFPSIEKVETLIQLNDNLVNGLRGQETANQTVTA